MSSGMWFIVCVPTADYEKECSDETEKKNEVEESSSAYRTPSTETFSTAYTHSDTEEILKSEQNDAGDNEILVRKSSSKIFERIPENEEKKKREKNDDKSIDSDNLVYFVDKDVPLEKVLKETLDSLGIINAVWTSAREVMKLGIIHDEIKSNAIFHDEISVVPCAVFYQDTSDDDENNNAGSEEDSKRGSTESLKSKSENKKGRSFSKAVQHKFLKSVTSRLTVAQVVEGVRANANLSFDFVMFVILASMIAAIGLIENSSVILVASMLISPLMGPILAGTFGAVIQDGPLRNLGIKTEIIGLLLCVIFGFVFGLISSPFSEGWGKGQWPTTEMTARGESRSLWVGVLVALPSGAGVALSVLGGNAGSLVGVAISASLLPPAVNAGLLWALSAVKALKAVSETVMTEPNSTVVINPSLSPPSHYKMVYAGSMEKECAILGVISLLLTLLNIICIFIMAVIVLKIKEVAPHTSIPQTKRFWKQDIKTARDYNKTLAHKDARTLGKQFLTEWANLNNIDPKEVFSQTHQAKITQIETLKDIVQDVETDDVYQTVMRCIPNVTPQPLSQCLNLITWPAPDMVHSSSRPSIWDLGLITGSSSDIAVGKESLFKTADSRHLNNVTFGKNKINVLPKKQKLKMPAWSVDSMGYWPVDSYSDLDLKDKRQGNSSFLVTTVNSYHSEGYLRPSVSSQNPYTLWPSSWLKSSRFVVTPVREMEKISPRSYLGKGLPSSNFDTVTTC